MTNAAKHTTGVPAAQYVTGIVRMSNGTRRPARKWQSGVVEFSTFGNANVRRAHSWRTASAKQAETFEQAEA